MGKQTTKLFTAVGVCSSSSECCMAVTA